MPQTFKHNRIKPRFLGGLGKPSEMRSYEPSYRENIQNLIGGALRGLGMSKFGARDLGERVTGLAEWSPFGLLTAKDDAARAAEAGDYMGAVVAGLGAVPIVGKAKKAGKAAKGLGKVANPLDKLSASGGSRTYPLAKEWYGDMNYRETGGRMVEMTPDEYLAQTRSMKMDDLTQENVDDLKRHVEGGGELDPLALYGNGKEDGRHRALAAKALGIEKVPVLTWRPDWRDIET